MFKIILLSIAYVGFVACGSNQAKSHSEVNEKDEKKTAKIDKNYIVKNIKQYEFENKKAKNIILLIGDGMGTAQIYSAITANKQRTYFEQFKNIGFSKTSSADNYTTDSGAGATALATGQKTDNQKISVDTENKPLKTILEIAENNGKSTGLISTSSITHATPASFIAHQPSRKLDEAIAADFLKTDIDLFIGGGLQFFEKREDKKNLLKTLRENNYEIATTIEAVQNFNGKKLVALLAEEHLSRYSERKEFLVPAAKKSFEILNKNKKGFFVMIEGSQIDWACHKNDPQYLVEEITDFDRAIGEALKFAEKDKNTLVIVIADHETGGLTINKGDRDTGEFEARFTTEHHTSTMVPVFAYGPGSELFRGIYENTEVFNKMISAFGVKSK